MKCRLQMNNTSAKEGTVRGHWPEHVLLGIIESLGCKCLSLEMICDGFCQGTGGVPVLGPPLQGSGGEAWSTAVSLHSWFPLVHPYPEWALLILEGPLLELLPCGEPGLWCLPPSPNKVKKKKSISLILPSGQKQLLYPAIIFLSFYFVSFSFSFCLVIYIPILYVCVYISTHMRVRNAYVYVSI